jgi:hypothetical protein
LRRGGRAISGEDGLGVLFENKDRTNVFCALAAIEVVGFKRFAVVRTQFIEKIALGCVDGRRLLVVHWNFRSS